MLQKGLLLLSSLHTIQSCNCITGTCAILGTKQGSFTRKTLLAPTANPKPSCSFCPCCLGRRLTFFAEAGVLSRGLVQVRGVAGPGVFPWVSVNVQVQLRSHWCLHTQKAQPPVSQATLTFTAFHCGQQTFTHFMLTIQTENDPNRMKKPYSLV